MGKIKLTEQDVKEASDILELNDSEVKVEKEIEQTVSIKNSIVVIILIIMQIMEFLSNTVNVANYFEEKMPEIIESYGDLVEKNKFESNRVSIK